jgi:hypothetical protein
MWSEGVKTSEIYEGMTVQYGDNCMNKRKVYKLVERFRGWQTNVDDVSSRWPSNVPC